MYNTAEEIKAHINLKDVVRMYGFKENHSGLIKCPFHDDKTASMKVYKNNYHCFACGAHGDVIDWVKALEHCDFKTAFQRLGGEYSGEIEFVPLKDEKKELERSRRKEQMYMLGEQIEIIRRIINESEPLSETWCHAVNMFQYKMYVWNELWEQS